MTIRGTVVHGKGEGSAIGYPTANLSYDSGNIPERGVWTARVLVDFRAVEGLAVVGMWTQGNDLPSVEVHLLDFKENLYDKEIAVSLVKKLRDVESFPSVESLIAQIKKDEEAARAFFAV